MQNNECTQIDYYKSQKQRDSKLHRNRSHLIFFLQRAGRLCLFWIVGYLSLAEGFQAITQTNPLLWYSRCLYSPRDDGQTYGDSFTRKIRFTSRRSSSLLSHGIKTERVTSTQDDVRSIHNSHQLSRRQAVRNIGAVLTTTAAIPSVNLEPANAGLPEIDSKSGQLYSPKNEMLGGGGSNAARGTKIQSKNVEKSKDGAPVQTVYNNRFIAYLTRFLFNFDPSARSWWDEQTFLTTNNKNNRKIMESQKQLRFSEFAESVEIGLADYFVGPYGSYASVQAAKAGLLAANPASSKSSGIQDKAQDKDGILSKLFNGMMGKSPEEQIIEKKDKRGGKFIGTKRNYLAKQGILNLFALLKARYTSVEAKSQLSLLFTLISSPILQPTDEIKGLLGEIDNSKVSAINFENTYSSDNFRESSRRGGGYAEDELPEISVEQPPPLGDEYRRAKVFPIMKATSRVLRIDVLDGGAGYTKIPSVKVIQNGVKTPCDACAVLDGNGSIESVIVLNPGFGYGGDSKSTEIEIPEIQITPPRGKNSENNFLRKANVTAILEYAIVGLDIIEGGNGYVTTQPPRIVVSPPEDDPDWYIDPLDQRKWNYPNEISLKAEVSSMTCSVSNKIFDVSSLEKTEELMLADYSVNFEKMSIDPLALFESSLRPQFVSSTKLKVGSKSFSNGIYIIPSLPVESDLATLPSTRYRAFDPIFGGVGAKPVTKGATSLSSAEYSRLALSGGLCTVIVRTALNPLELVKTKLQLQNDDELMQYAVRNLDTSHKLHNNTKVEINRKNESVEVADPSWKDDASVREENSERNTDLRSVKSSDEHHVSDDKGISPNMPTNSIEVRDDDTEDDNTEDIGTVDIFKSIIDLRGPFSLFQSADITFLASLVFGSFGFGATELFRRIFTSTFSSSDGTGGSGTVTLLLAATIATVITSAAAAPFEILRVRSMGYIEPQGWTKVLSDFLLEKRKKGTTKLQKEEVSSSNGMTGFISIKKEDLGPLFSGFAPILSRELPFAVTKFLVFDMASAALASFISAQPQAVEPIQVGVGPVGLAVSAISGAMAGLVGACISHPADLVLTLTSSSKKKEDPAISESDGKTHMMIKEEGKADWLIIIEDLLKKEGGFLNLYTGLSARAVFFFLVVGLQFFLYDYVKNVLDVGSEDLTLVLDVFYAIRQGL